MPIRKSLKGVLVRARRDVFNKGGEKIYAGDVVKVTRHRRNGTLDLHRQAVRVNSIDSTDVYPIE